MATTILDQAAMTSFSVPKPLRVCFSYAAYAKNLIHHLQYANIPVDAGLSDTDFSAVESSLNFAFPPDLRSILQEGLPIGPGFPNWRSSSKQHLQILISLPNAPILVPIYGHFYIPSSPPVAGNPVFYVRGGDVKLWSFDIAGFFQKVEFCNLCSLFAAPAWAAKEARRIEFWTEMAERGAARVERGAWWSGELGGCLEEVFWRLRDGGWKMEDVREMMMMIDGCDHHEEEEGGCGEVVDRECVEWRVRTLSERLLSAGWSREDVVDSLGCSHDFDDDGDSCFDFHHTISCDDQNNPLFTFQFKSV